MTQKKGPPKKKPKEGVVERNNLYGLPEHISVSQINRYTMCPRQYQYSYIDKIKQPPAFVLDMGSAVHQAIEENYIKKTETGKEMDVNEVVHIYSKTLTEREDIARQELSNDMFGMYRNIVKKEALKGAEMIRIYHKEIASKTDPLFIEEEFMLTLGKNHRPLYGIIDLVDKKHALADTKTSARTYQQSQADSSLQLTTYYAALREEKGIDPTQIRFDVLVKTKEPKLQQLETTRTVDDIISIKKLIKGVDEEIRFSAKRGYFRPNPSQQTCSWCGFGPNAANICKAGRPFKKLDKR